MEETKLKNHFIGMKDNVLYLREYGSNWTSNYDSEESLLSTDAEMIFEHTINNLKFGNDILLIKDSFSNDYFDFGIKITKEGFMPNKSLLELYSLCEAENNSTYPMTSRLNVKFNNYYSITSFFECPSLTTEVKDKTEWMKLFKLLEEAGKSVGIYCLHLFKTDEGKAGAKLLLAADDLYNLKSASKLFRNAGNNYEEYFYQKEECSSFLKTISNRENIKIEKDDAHRIIFENTNTGDVKNEKE